MATRFVEPKLVAEQTENDADVQAEIDAADADEGGEDHAEQQQEQGEKPSEAESRARRLGWHPKDEYEASGRDPSKWVDAETFIKRGEEELPILRDRFRKMERLYEQQEKKLDEGNKLLSDLVKSQADREKKAVEKAIAGLKTERREAISNGDVQRAEELSDEITEAQEDLKRVEAKKPVETKQDAKTDIPKEVLDWAEENKSWFIPGEPEYATAVAFYGKQDQSLPEEEKLRKTKAEIVRRFPEKFGNPRRQQQQAVESGNGAGRPRNGVKGWNDIPADDRAIAERLIKQGAVKDKASYVKDYFGQSAA